MKPEFGNVEQIRLIEHEAEMVKGLKNPVRCTGCKGTGLVENDWCDDDETCTECNGNGAREKRQ